MNLNSEALNFQFLLLEFYKELGLKEDEVMVILMLNHLVSPSNTFVSSDELSLKMSFSKKEIDDILCRLFVKKLIDIGSKNNKSYTSIDPLKELVFKHFQEKVFKELEINNDSIVESTRKEVFTEIEKLFGRSLTPTEMERVDDWIISGTDKRIILDSIKDAKNKNIVSINQIDRIIIKKMREEDNSGNEIKR